MPTYQYACTECDHAFEQVQSFTEDSLTTCPQCEGRLRKVFNAVGVVFKGSGFYRTDNRPTASSTSGSGSTGASSNGASSNGSSDSSGSSAASSSAPAAATASSSEGSAA